MAEESYGSVAKPVQLDPFRNIVEVHWRGDGFIKIEFVLKLEVSITGESAVGPGPPFVEPHSLAFATEAVPEYASEPRVSVWGGSGWLQTEDASLSGVPDLPPAITFDDWEVQGFDVPENGLFEPLPHWLDGSGSPVDIDHPAASGFLDTLINAWEVLAQNFISEALASPISGTVPKWATFDPDLVQKDTFSLNVSGLSASLSGKSYLPVGTRVDASMTRTLTVLLQREPPSP